MSARARLVTLAIVATVGLSAVVARRLADRPRARAPAEIEDYLFWQPRPLVDFMLARVGGRSFGPSDFEGRWTFVFFGYTHCPDVCPLTLAVLAQVWALLEKEPSALQQAQALFVSVDPGRDTPESLADYVAYFDRRFVGVTGSAKQVDALSRQVGALYSIHAKPAEGVQDSYLVTHNSTIFLVDPQGRLFGRFPPPHAPLEVVEVFLKIRTFHADRSRQRWAFW